EEDVTTTLPNIINAQQKNTNDISSVTPTGNKFGDIEGGIPKITEAVENIKIPHSPGQVKQITYVVKIGIFEFLHPDEKDVARGLYGILRPDELEYKDKNLN
ncbi:hypothetical protein CHS0354_026928, partial [Potamilus streckersoni]